MGIPIQCVKAGSVSPFISTESGAYQSFNGNGTRQNLFGAQITNSFGSSITCQMDMVRLWQDMKLTKKTFGANEIENYAEFESKNITSRILGAARAFESLNYSYFTQDIPWFAITDEAERFAVNWNGYLTIMLGDTAQMNFKGDNMSITRAFTLIALVALYRPGPMANIPTYCARKHGDEEPEYLHPMLEPILKETFGVIIYQEQVMQIAQVMAGYSLGDADLLRRAMGKKIRAEMDKQRAIFVDGAVKNGVAKDQADTIFDLLAKFADYGFNKSHAAAYALVSYHTAYMKAHYPVEFIAASMTLDMANTDKLAGFAAAMRARVLKVEAPAGAVDTVAITERDFALAKKIEEFVLWRPGAAGGPLEGTPADERYAYLKGDA